MSLVIGDLHGDIVKLEAFLSYKPKEEHINVGDICDDWTASESLIEKCIRLAFSKKANLVNLVGNHEIPYMFSPPFWCSGHRAAAKKTFTLIRKHEKEFKMAIVRDGFIITHAGVDAYFHNYQASLDMIAASIEFEWQDWLNSDRNKDRWQQMPIFMVSKISGGTSEYGGPLWARPGFDNIDRTISQVFGHTERRDIPRIEFEDKEFDVIHANVDIKKYICFNTKTREFESFGHGMTTKEFAMLTYNQVYNGWDK